MKARRLLRAALLLIVLLGAGAALLWALRRDRAAEWLADEVGRTVAAAVHLPVELEGPSLQLLPPAMAVRRMAVGDAGAAAQLRDLVLQLRLWESLRAARPVLSAAVSDVSVDLRAFAAARRAPRRAEPRATAPALPPLALALALRGASLRVADDLTLVLQTLDIELASGPVLGLSLDGRAAGLVASRGDRHLAIDSLAAAARLVDGEWRLDRGAAHGPALDLTVAGSGDPPRHRVEARGDLRVLTELLPEQWRASGGLSAQVDVVGDLADPEAEGTVQIADAVFAGVAMRRVEAAAKRGGGRVVVPSLRIEAGDGELTLHGEVGESAPFAVRGTVVARDFDLRTLGPLVEEMKQAAARLDGSIDFDAALQPLAGNASGQGVLRADGGAAFDWTAGLEVGEGGQALRVDASQAGGGALAVRLNRSAEAALHGTVHADLVDVAPVSHLLAGLVPPALLPSAGSARVDAAIAGTVDRPVVDGEVTARGLILRGRSIESLRAGLRVDARAAEVRRAELLLPAGRVEASGTFAVADDVANAWRASGTGVDAGWVLAILEDLDVLPPLPVEGQAIAAVHASGPWRDLALDGRTAIDGGSVVGQPFRHLRADFRKKGKAWNVDAAMSGDEAARLDVRIADAGTGHLRLALAGDGWNLNQLHWLRDSGLSGVVALRADFAGPLGRWTGEGTAHSDDVQIGGVSRGPVDVRLAVRNGDWTLQGEALARALTVRATVAAVAALPLQLEATFDQLDVARLLGAQSDVSALLSGSLSVAGPLRNPERLAARMTVAQFRLAHAGDSLELSAPLNLQLSRGEVEIPPFEITATDTKVRGSGRIGRGGAVQLALTGDSSLRWLEAVLGPPLESARGDIHFDVRVTGAAGRPVVLAGEIRLSQGAVDFGDEYAFDDIEGAFALRNDIVEVRQLDAEMAGGRVSVRGTIGISAGPDLQWEMRDIGLAPARALEVELQGSGTLRGAWDKVVLGGEVNIVQLLYERNLEIADLLPSFNRALRPAPKGDQARPPVRLDLRLRARDSLYVENNIARLEGKADLHITGTLRAPRFNGEVSIIDGIVRLRGREFEVVSGSLSFRPTLRNVAAIDFRAESVIETSDESYAVGVRVSGLSNDYRVALTSTDGSLTPTDVASLITFGNTVAQLQSGEGRGDTGGAISMDTLVELAGNNLGGHLAEEAEHVLPFDQVEFRPQFSTTTGQFEPEVRVGKRLSEDLSAWIGQTFGVRSRTTVETEYRLTATVASALSWESSTSNEQGALGAEVRLRRDYWRLAQLFFFGSGR